MKGLSIRCRRVMFLCVIKGKGSSDNGGAKSICLYQKAILRFCLFADVFIHRPISFASAVVLAFEIASEESPRSGAIDVFVVDVMHRDRDTEDGGEGEEIRTNVAIGDSAVVGTPMVHDFVGASEVAFAIAARSEPSAGPGVVGSLPEGVADFVRKMDAIAFDDLENRSKAFDDIETNHGHWHLGAGEIAGAISSAAEVTKVSIGPSGGVHALLDVFIRHLPPGLHDVVAILIGDFAAGIDALSTAVDEVEETIRFFGVAFDVITSDALDARARPIGTDIGEDGSAAIKEALEEHADGVKGVIFGSEGIGLSRSDPVEGAVEDCLREVAVRIEVGPLTLTLEATDNRVVAKGFFFAAFGEVFVPVEEIFDDAAHLDREFPVFFFLFGAALELFGVLVDARVAVLFHPSEGTLIFLVVIDAQGHAADDFNFVDAFNAKAEVFFHEVIVHERAADTHGGGANLEIALAAERSSRNSGAGEAEDLGFDVVRDAGIVFVLDFVAIDAESRKAFLSMSGKDGGEINRARTLGAIEAPNGFDGHRIHVHGLRAIAPARSDGQSDVDAFLFEVFGAGGAFRDAADGRRSDDNLNGRSIAVTDVFLKQFLGCDSHAHRLVFQRLSDFERSSSAIDGRADTDNGVAADKTRFRFHVLTFPFNGA